MPKDDLNFLGRSNASAANYIDDIPMRREKAEAHLPKMLDYDRLKAVLQKKKANFSEHPSQEDYDKYGTIEEDGKKKYPIRPGDEKDAEDALRLVHHEKNPKKREEVEEAAHAEIERDEAKKHESE